MDQSNHRVLRFDNAATQANGANANGVLGEPDFITSTAPNPPSASSMASPVGAAIDSSGRLYVGDFTNNRVLIFNAAATLANGANADNVLGQPGFITRTADNGGLSASALNGPYHVFFDNASQNLFVSDEANNRVLRFGQVTGPTAARVMVSGRVLTSDGRGLRNATVVLIDEKGNAQRVRTGSLGSYTFAGVSVGQTYVMAVESNLYRYTPQLITLTDAKSGIDFTPAGNARGKTTALPPASAAVQRATPTRP